MTPEERQAAFTTLVEDGLTFAECMTVFAAKDTDPMHEWYCTEARDTLTREGEVEVDDTTIVSGSDDNGEYVLAWVWVDAPSCSICDEDITLVPNGDGEPWWVDGDGQGLTDDGHSHRP